MRSWRELIHYLSVCLTPSPQDMMHHPRLCHPLVKVMVRVWTLPNTLLGVMIGVPALLTGGGVQVERGVIEFYGGSVAWLLTHCSVLQGGIAAITFGHCVLGQSEVELARTRNHEHIHVCQYEWWGILFIPAYLTSSLVISLIGKRGYLDNPFETEAYRREHEPVK